MSDNKKSRFIKKSNTAPENSTKSPTNSTPTFSSTLCLASSTSASAVTPSIEVITCGICFDAYSKIKKAPITLTCGHSFCRVCISKLGKNKARVTCGVCRADTRCVSKKMGKNFQLVDLLEKLGLLQDEANITEEPVGFKIDEENPNNHEMEDQQENGNIRVGFEEAENFFDSLRSRLEILQTQINSRVSRPEEPYIFPRLQDRYDMLKEDVEHLEEKLEELKEECQTINTEMTTLSEDLNENNFTRSNRGSRLSRFRLDRARNLFGPIFRFGQSGRTRSFGRGRSASLSSDEGFIFGRIGFQPQNQINIVLRGPSNEGHLQINDNSNDVDELPSYGTWNSPSPAGPLDMLSLDADNNYITRSYSTNPNGKVMARCYLCDVTFYDDNNSILTHCRGSRHRALSQLNQNSNWHVFNESDDEESTSMAQPEENGDLVNLFEDISNSVSSDAHGTGGNRQNELINYDNELDYGVDLNQFDSNFTRPHLRNNYIRPHSRNYTLSTNRPRYEGRYTEAETNTNRRNPRNQEFEIRPRNPQGRTSIDSNDVRNSSFYWSGRQRQENPRENRTPRDGGNHSRRVEWGSSRDSNRRAYWGNNSGRNDGAIPFSRHSGNNAVEEEIEPLWLAPTLSTTSTDVPKQQHNHRNHSTQNRNRSNHSNFCDCIIDLHEDSSDIEDYIGAAHNENQDTARSINSQANTTRNQPNPTNSSRFRPPNSHPNRFTFTNHRTNHSTIAPMPDLLTSVEPPSSQMASSSSQTAQSHSNSNNFRPKRNFATHNQSTNSHGQNSRNSGSVFARNLGTRRGGHNPPHGHENEYSM